MPSEPRPTLAGDYWELMAEMARLQGELGKDLIAWARMYQAGGHALERSSRTLGDMAELGRRMERFLESGPPAVVTQIMRMFTSPWPGAGVGMGIPTPAGGAAPEAFARWWDAWASSLLPHDASDPGQPG